MPIEPVDWRIVRCQSCESVVKSNNRGLANSVSSRASPVPLFALCVGSNGWCDDKQCCPSFDGSLHRTFRWFNADDNFDGCGTNFKYDLDNASFLVLTNSVYDRLSVETTDNDGEAVLWMSKWWGEWLEESRTCCSRPFLKLENGKDPVVTLVFLSSEW